MFAVDLFCSSHLLDQFTSLTMMGDGFQGQRTALPA